MGEIVTGTHSKLYGILHFALYDKKGRGGGGEIDNECARNGHNCVNYMLVQKCQFIMISKGVGLGPHPVYHFSIFYFSGG